MAPKKPLPFPELVDRFDDCLGCGYPFAGLPAPGLCPECGVGFDEGQSVLLIAGIGKGTRGPLWRKIVWVLIGILAFVYSQLLGILVISWPWISLVIFLMLVASTIAMAMTNKQKSRGTEMFALTRDGLSRWTLGSKPDSRDFVRWDGINPGVFVRRVSRVWASLKIVYFDDEGKRIIPLECGFRCLEDRNGWVEGIVSAFVEGREFRDIESPEPNKDQPPSIPLL